MSAIDNGMNGRGTTYIKYDGKSWPIWKMKVRAVLQSQGLLHVIDNVKCSDEKLWKAQQRSVYTILTLSLDDIRLEMIMAIEEGDAIGVWTVLTKHFERQTTASRAHTRSMLHKTKMDANEDFDIYHSRVMQLCIKLKAMNETISEGELIYVLLEGLPESYNQLKQSLVVQDAITVEKICEHVRDHQERIAHTVKIEEIETANYVRGGRGGEQTRDGRNGIHNARMNNNSCHICSAADHWASSCPRRKGTGRDCYWCGRADHEARDCRRPKGRQEESMYADGGAHEVPAF